MNRLVFGTSYIASRERAELLRVWCRSMRRLSVGHDLAIVDSASPWIFRDYCYDDCISGTKFDLIQLGDNIGHLNGGGRDGSGRALMVGLQYAIDHDYDQVACIDTDILFARPIAPIFDKLAKAGVKAAAPMDNTYWFIESGILFFDVPWLKESGFIAKYDWENPPPNDDPKRNPERRIELACGDDLFFLPLRGLRNDFGKLTPETLDRMHFPYGLDYLTHLGNFSLAWKFLEFNGLSDV